MYPNDERYKVVLENNLLCPFEATPFDTYIAPTPAMSLSIPSDPLVLHTWVPNSLVVEKMNVLTSEDSLNIPSDTTFANMPLTFYYILWLADSLVALSRPKLAMLCLGWSRCVLLYTPGLANREIAWATLHYKLVSILNNLALLDELKTLPTVLGNTSIECASFVSKLATPVLRSSGDIAANNQASLNNTSDLFGLSAVTQTITKIEPIIAVITNTPNYILNTYREVKKIL
jgi:hypothetical protein